MTLELPVWNNPLDYQFETRRSIQGVKRFEIDIRNLLVKRDFSCWHEQAVEFSMQNRSLHLLLQNRLYIGVKHI